MSETTDYALVKAEIASFIGTPEASWTARESSDVESAIRKGIEAVIHNSATHQWTWMRPTHRFKTADGQRRYTLPLDFEQFIDHLSFDGENYQYPSITQLPASRLDQLHAEYNSTGVPINFALEVMSHDGTSQQHQQLVLHPTPNDAYDILGQYQVGPIRNMSTARPWFPGGPENRELFIASCLATVESKFMDKSMTDKQEEFKTALVGAIGRDYRKQPRNLKQTGKRKNRDWYRWKLSTTYLGGTDV